LVFKTYWTAAGGALSSAGHWKAATPVIIGAALGGIAIDMRVGSMLPPLGGFGPMDYAPLCSIAKDVAASC
jgi:hypothetical protein